MYFSLPNEVFFILVFLYADFPCQDEGPQISKYMSLAVLELLSIILHIYILYLQGSLVNHINIHCNIFMLWEHRIGTVMYGKFQ